MSKKSKLVKYKKELLNPKYSTRAKSRCPICGRPRGYIREFDMCRICFRGLVRDGMVPGVRKSSW